MKSSSGSKVSQVTGKIAYGFLFVVVLPALLTLWAVQVEEAVTLQVPDFSSVGIASAVAGFLLMGTGSVNLVVQGMGLPMNPYPPKQLVDTGIYSLIKHPIYVGACALTIGISVAAGSAGGFWLVSPMLILGCVALVMGFERQDLHHRLGEFRKPPRIGIPAASTESADRWDVVSACVLVLIPWLALYELILFVGIPPHAVSTWLDFESRIPVLEFSEAFYAATYLFVAVVPFIAKTRADLRDFMVSGLVCTGLGIFFHVCFPFVAHPKPFIPTSFLGQLLELERLYDSPAAAFPAFHVIWAFIAAAAFQRRFPSRRVFWIAIPVLISLSCITTGMHSVADVLAGFVVYLAAQYRGAVWSSIQTGSEWIANSWKEYTFWGRIRVINHGVYGAAATFTGISLAGFLAGAEHHAAILFVTVIAMIISLLWAQILEGSKKLLRPLGFYGGVVGVVMGCALAQLFFDSEFFVIWGGFAVAAPWIQAIGRLRCLVQGCCHGRICEAGSGIRYFHERSRVVRLGDLKGKYLYPTPVYSILCNFVYGVFLLKLWFSGVSIPLIIGLSFLFNGFVRFVEESYRGEPQTPVVGGLRLYQWLALGGVILGAILTTLPFSGNHPAAAFSGALILLAGAGGLVAFVTTGVDFPRSEKRFSRLV